MSLPEHKARLCNVFKDTVFKQLVDAISDLPPGQLADSVVFVDVFLETCDTSTSRKAETAAPEARRQLISLRLDLARILNCSSQQHEPSESVHHPNPPADVEQELNITTESLNESRSAVRKRAGLRPATVNPRLTAADADNVEVPNGENTKRQLQLKDRSFPKRTKVRSDVPTPKESTVTKFLFGVWEQIHSGAKIEPEKLLRELQQYGSAPSLIPASTDSSSSSLIRSNRGSIVATSRISASSEIFRNHNFLCRRITLLSRSSRAMEVVVQARWIESFDGYVSHLASSSQGLSPTKARQAALASACQDFGWNEKELRNKMAIWRGYKEIKDAGGWVMLVFAGMGLYRMCKYRVGFDDEVSGLKKVLAPAQGRTELAADTLQPGWRTVLSLVGIEGEGGGYTGHPHDWVVAAGDNGDVVPLKRTYRDGWLDEFQHISDCVLDRSVWEDQDPRRVAGGEVFICEECKGAQSDSPEANACHCFPSLFGCAERPPTPVQIFQTTNGRNNGLQALLPFDRGVGIGEFVGLVTKGIDGVDVMDAVAGTTRYQIWQGTRGNFTRFINHSCNPNSQFQSFIWLGIQKIILVSKGIEAGMEITVDYSHRYWKGLKKKCLCGEKCCKY